MSSTPPGPRDPALEERASRGAENLARRCLAVQPNEPVALFHHRRSPAVELVESALRAERVALTTVSLEALDERALEEKLEATLQRVTASVAVGAPLPPSVSMAIVRATQSRSLRHVHIPWLDMRVLASSSRADPTVIARLNRYVRERLSAARSIRFESAAGTALEARTGAGYPLIEASGRPGPGEWDNSPSGILYFHPANVHGTFVADRIAHSAGYPIDARRLRNAPIVLRFANGRVAEHRCVDREIAETFARYLAAHANAGRVGFLCVPTNYLALAEFGHVGHDGLLPGLRLQLSFSDASSTRAPYDLDFGCWLTARKLTVRCGGDDLVHEGRFAGELARLASLVES